MGYACRLFHEIWGRELWEKAENKNACGKSQSMWGERRALKKGTGVSAP